MEFFGGFLGAKKCAGRQLTIMSKKQTYQLLKHGKPVPMTKCETMAAMISCVRSHEATWRLNLAALKGNYASVRAASPYTIGAVTTKEAIQA